MISPIYPNQSKPKLIIETLVHPFPIHSETDKAAITELLTILDEASIIGLAAKMFRLAEVGAQINHVHPLTFLKVILTDPILKMRLKRIFDSSYKRLGMMTRNALTEGFSNKLDFENNRGNIEPYVEAFSTALNVPAEEIRPLIRSAAWTDLCFYLLEKTCSQ